MLFMMELSFSYRCFFIQGVDWWP